MNRFIREEVSFAKDGEDPRFAPIKAIQLTKKIHDWIVSVWPTWWKLYQDQIVLVSKNWLHTTILRSSSDDELRKYLAEWYRVVNGKYRME